MSQEHNTKRRVTYQRRSVAQFAMSLGLEEVAETPSWIPVAPDVKIKIPVILDAWYVKTAIPVSLEQEYWEEEWLDIPVYFTLPARLTCVVCLREFHVSNRHFVRIDGYISDDCIHCRSDRLETWNTKRQYSWAAYHRVRRNIVRAQEARLPARFTMNDWFYALEYFDYKCVVCNASLVDINGDEDAHADHWFPISMPKSAGTVPENIIPLCADCNWSKSDKNPYEWLQDRLTERRYFIVRKTIDDYIAHIKNRT
jgi:5-methylcytosine-specific restriction endonuclease McrA